MTMPVAAPVGLSSLPAVMAIIVSRASVMGTVVRHIYFVVPFVTHEIDRPVAGIVSVTVPAPFFCVSRRHMEINRLMDHMGGCGPDYNWPGIDYLRAGGVADIDAPIEPWLADTDGNIDIRGLGLR